MKLETFQYIKGKGWSVASFPKMDSEHTLVLVLASPNLIKDLAPLQELSTHYPNSKIIGCSTAGEILGDQITDDSISVAIVKFEKTHLKIVKTEVDTMESSLKAGEEIAKHLNEPNLRNLSFG